MRNLLEKIEKTYSSASYEKILKAYNFAKEAHKGQLRQSGEEYFLHPCAVAEILVDFGLDADTIIAAFLHDVVEDTVFTREKIVAEFGTVVASLVDGVTKLSKLNFKSSEEEQAENYRRMFLAMSKDIRVIIIKLADRLHNMRTLGYKPEESQKRIARETLEIYAPIASRLGIGSLKGELEDLSFRYLYPQDYYDIVEKVANTRRERQNFVEKISADLFAKLDELGIKGEVNGRPKHFYSIYRKMRKGKTFEQIYDLIAMRIIVDTVKDCYTVLGAVHTMWKPLPGRFKDYISVPKTNMYQSLHTTVITSYGSPFEIQIRTSEMHRMAEYGIAAHWKYKQGNLSANVTTDDEKLGWIRNVMELQNEVSDSQEYLDFLKVDLYVDQVYVFTPSGDVINLPAGSTGIDFAYNVHSEVGNKCVGVKINTRMMPVSTKLENGDVIEILTSNNSKGPSRDWLKFVVTPNAKSKIKTFFKKANREENIRKGKDMLEHEAKHKGYSLAELLSCEEWKEYFPTKYGAPTLEDIYAMVGYGGLTTAQVLSKLIEFFRNEVESKRKIESIVDTVKAQPQVIERKQHKSSSNKAEIEIKGVDNCLYKLARCCNPLPGDNIVGYVSRGKGVTVHRLDCPNCKNFDRERLLDASWLNAESNMAGGYVSMLDIYAEDRQGLVIETATVITGCKINMRTISARVLPNTTTAVINVEVEVKSASELDGLIKKLKSSVKGISEISRSNG